MPTVLREGGFEIKIYFNDHEPAHVHALKSAGEAKIEIDPVRVVQVWNLKKQDAGRARRLVSKHQVYLMEKWKEING